MYRVDGNTLLLCDNCYEAILASQRKMMTVMKPHSRHSSESVTERPIVVTFVSPPLGISLQCGAQNRNATLVRVDRFDNNDNGMKVPLNSSIMQINDTVVIDMDYLAILTLIKKASFPVTIVFGTLTYSMKTNLINLLCRNRDSVLS